ncbi:MAG TPA: hypothetical protein VFY07_07545 [Geomobilimonas sp.]|nr:hypothetical protein [Geomobilimonas sp.]
MMQRIYALIVIAGFMSCPSTAQSEDSGILTNCRQIGAIRVTISKGLDAKARNALDALAPELRAIGKDRLLRIEGHDGTGRNAEESLTNSLMLAKNVQLYLASRHAVDLDVYLATASGPDKRRTVSIYACPKQFAEENLDLPRNITDNKRGFEPSPSDR